MRDDAASPRLWHAMAADQVLAAVAGHPGGLSTEEARRRLAEWGPNRLTPPPVRGPLRRFLAQFNNLLIYILLVAAAVSAALDHWLDTGVILAVVLVNAAIGFVQEGKAEKALEAIRDMLSPHAQVLRDGVRVTVPAEELVPGDVVFVQSGDKLPADLRILRAKTLLVQEAALTGESNPVEKGVAPVAEAAPLGDRSSMAYSGTLVAYGQASGVVVATGDASEIGRVSAMLAEVQPLTTPLLKQMEVFARWLTLAILGLAGVTFGFGFLVRGYDPTDMFMAAVGLAVAAIPEGLPAILTVTLAIGVQRMARRNAIIRRLPAVETLGSVTIICSDKTGTLTRNELTARSVVTAEGSYAVGGVGYEPHGGFSRNGRDIAADECADLAELLCAALLCNDARLEKSGESWLLHGDPTDGALLAAAMKGGLDPAMLAKEWPRTDLIPFESEHRFMATLHHDHAGNGQIHVKGAPERILAMCGRERRGDGGTAPLDVGAWTARMDELAARGERVIAVAVRPAPKGAVELTFADVEEGLVLLGLFGLIDPPREEALKAIGVCRRAGIRVKMITGDHGRTAAAIASQLGLINAGEFRTGNELDAIADEDLQRVAAKIDVFARASPAHKLRLVRALQAGGGVVAMTGDGVNDAPALKQADVGVAMGLKGTEAAKEAAEMVLADDNFASIAHAVEQGRTVYDNLKKAILFLLPVNGGESFSIIIAILAGTALPITPLQILWVNMVSSVTLAMALAFEPTEPNAMARRPRPPGEPLLTGFVLWRIGLVTVVFVSGIFGMFLYQTASGASVEEARTVAVNTLVMLEVFYLFSVRYLHAPSLTPIGVLGTRPVLVAVGMVAVLQFAFTYAPFMQVLFATRALDPVQLVQIFGVGVLGFAVVELEKWVLRSRGARPRPSGD